MIAMDDKQKETEKHLFELFHDLKKEKVANGFIYTVRVVLPGQPAIAKSIAYYCGRCGRFELETPPVMGNLYYCRACRYVLLIA